MTVHWYDQFNSVLSFVVQAVLLIGLVLRRGSLRLPWLTGYVGLAFAKTVLSCCLQGSQNFYALYFYLYWSLEAAGGLSGFGVLFELTATLPLIRLTPRNLRTGFLTFAGLVTVSCGAIAASHGPASYFLTSLALSLQHCIAVAWAVFGLTLFVGAAILGYGWPRRSLMIACGFMFQTAVFILTTLAANHTPRYNRALTLFAELCAIPVFAWWSLAVYDTRAFTPEALPAAIETVDVLRRHNKPFIPPAKGLAQ